MKIYFPLDTLKALVKAGCQSEDLSDPENVYRGLEIESREIVPEDFPIIKRIIQTDEHSVHIENRRILKKLQALEDLKTSPSGKKTKALKILDLVPEAIRDVIGQTPHRWLFANDPVYGAMMPYFLADAEYHEAERSVNGYSPAKVSIELKAICRGEEVGRTITLYKSSLKGTLAEILAKHDAIPETPTLVADHEAELRYYKDHHEKTGEQYLAVGRGKPEDSSAWNKTVNFERDGRPTKVVMDDLEGMGEGTGYTETDFWAKASVKKRGDDNEETFPLPVHPVVSVFSLESHEFADAHISSLKPYEYDPSIVDKLVLPEDHKRLIGTLTKISSEKFEDIIRGKATGVIVLCSGLPGTGKCLGLGTQILKFDGSVVPVEAVRSGDLLMGPDGKPRTVLSLSRGVGPLYKISPVKGEPWVCNDAHVLTLVNTDTGKTFDIPVSEWLAMKSRERNKLFTVGVNAFGGAEEALPIDPYFLGLWFGDGSKHVRKVAGSDALNDVSVSKPDREVLATCKAVAREWGMRVSTSGASCPTHHLVGGKSENRLIGVLRTLVGPSSVIPNAYLRASRKHRLEFLAGFLDADAELSNNCYIISQKRQDWAFSVWWLARSLGFCATRRTRTARCRLSDGSTFQGTYWVVSISGDVDQIPLRIARKKASRRRQVKIATRTGFDAVPIGDGEYYGFTLDGDGRFLLGDFTVTHNTLTAEVYSEVVKRPLYAVQCSQLGTDEEDLEKELQEVLARAARWKAILLIDEADVYIHERGNDIHQNAIVGVFLRLLEYFRGIMFMTTNREDVVDDAILSRVTAHVRYTPPSDKDKIRKLWSVFAAQFGAVNLDLDAAIKAFPGVSGRSIRQLLRLSAMTHPQSEISVKILQWAAVFYDFPELPDRKEKT